MTNFETGDDGSKFEPVKKQSLGKFVLHRFNGDEEFVLEEASLNITPDQQGNLVLELEAITNGTVIKSLPDTEGLYGSPTASIFVTIPRPATVNLVGMKLSLPCSYDELIEDFRTNFYYVEHESLEANEIEFLALKENKYWVKWTGETLDVNYYDGSKPDTRVEIEGWFTIASDDF